MNQILKISIILLLGLSISSCSDTKHNSIKKEWKNDDSYTKNYTFGLVNNTAVSICANYYTGQYMDITNKYNLLNILNNIYKNTELKNKIENNVATCSRKLMSKYTPQDMIKIIKLGFDSTEAQEMRHFVGTTIKK